LLESGAMSIPAKRRALERHGSLNPTPEAVTAEPFRTHPEFFDAHDKLQVRYEMLRAPAKGEMTVSQTCREFGVSRQTFYAVKRAFDADGIAGLADRKRGRKGPLKATQDVVEFVRAAKSEEPSRSGAQLTRLVAERFGVELHRRTVERLLVERKKKPPSTQAS
jgi:transposase